MDYDGYLQKIRACNNYTAVDKVPFLIDGKRVGEVKARYIPYLLQSGLFVQQIGYVTFHESAEGYDARTEAMMAFAEMAYRDGITDSFMNEPYAVRETPESEPLCLADRSVATLFGLIAFGQHINGFVRTREGLKMWIGKRAYNRGYEPGKLDHIAAGGLPYGISLSENLLKECYEEAGISEATARQAKATGLVSYRYDYTRGSSRDIIYCYDLELPEDFQPVNTDGEVEAFYLMDIEEVSEIVRGGNDFKLNCNLVIIDFLIRHGYLDPEVEGYFEIVSGLKGYK